MNIQRISYPVIWEILKWCSSFCYVTGTMLLLSPIIASTAVTPWVVFILGNTIQFVNFIHQKNIPFVCLSMFFFVWDTLIIIQRLTSIETLSIISTLIIQLDKLVL